MSGSISIRSANARSDRCASARPTAPTPAPTSAIRPSGVPAAAASRTASVPTRWPPFGWTRASRPPSQRAAVSPSATGSPSSPGEGSGIAQFPCEARLGDHSPRPSHFAGVDHDPSWQETERPLYGGHVLVGDEIGDPLRRQDRFDDADEDQIVGAQDFDQGRTSFGSLAASFRRLYGPGVGSGKGKRRVGVVIPLEEKSADRLIEPLMALVAGDMEKVNQTI